jgi:predicted metal-dependent hydrolase
LTIDELIIRRSPRARRVSISVRPGEVRLTMPPNYPLADALAFAESRRDWIERARKRIGEKVPQQPLSKEVVESRRAEAKRILPDRVARLAAEHGFRYTGLSFRNATSRWGSCSARNTLSLSIHLVRLPDHLADYIILHELCHTREKNHGPRFHALLDRVTGGRHRQLNRELKGYTPKL